MQSEIGLRNSVESQLTYIDLFAGCGGLSLGLYNAGWKGLFAIEKNPEAFLTLKHNLIDNKKHFSWPPWLPLKHQDIKKVLKLYQTELEKLQGEVTLVVGGPPCQGFSTAGQRNYKDSRNKLSDYYIEFIGLVKPKFVFLENVRGFTTKFHTRKSSSEAYSVIVTEKLKSLGYAVHSTILNFGEYGIPQNRNRFILIGAQEKHPEIIFQKLRCSTGDFLNEKKIGITTTLEDAISDLLQGNGVVDCPDSIGFKTSSYSGAISNYQKLMRSDSSNLIPESHRFANHLPETITLFNKILEKAPKNKRINNELRLEFNIKKRSLTPLSKDTPCHVLTTHPDDYIHYCEPRILTVREYARIQSFPDWFQFKGKYTTGGKVRKKEVPRYTQIGNAIPPLFAEQVGITLKQLVFSDE